MLQESCVDAFVFCVEYSSILEEVGKQLVYIQFILSLVVSLIAFFF
jgi:hypothetical protein